MQPILRHHNYFSFILPFESGKCGKQGKKNLKKSSNISRTKRALQMNQKVIFITFEINKKCRWKLYYLLLDSLGLVKVPEGWSKCLD